jgi:hypothetical protein
MTCRSILLSAGLVAMTSACSGGSSTSPGDSDGFDAEAEGAASDDAAGSSESDASALAESGSPSGTRDAGRAEVLDADPPAVHDAGIVRVSCSQLALGVCQTASVSGNAAASYRAQCTMQGGQADACPTSGLVGCCVGDTSSYCFYSIDYTTETAQKSCSTMNGTWSTTM